MALVASPATAQAAQASGGAESGESEAADGDLAESLSGVDASDWISAGLILAGAIVLSRIVRAVAARLVQRGDSERRAAQLVGRVLATLVLVAGFVYALSVLEVRLAPVLGALGIGGLALAFAAQAILENVFASVVLQTRRPFRRGDQILTTDAIEGTVEEVNLRTVVLRTYDGQLVYIPCAEVLNNPIVNQTQRGVRRTTLVVGVAYDSDLEQAQQVLLAAAAAVDGVRAQPPPEALVEQFNESSIDFAVRFWHDPDIATLWRVRSDLAIAVKRDLDAAGITIPFPQRTVGFRATDGQLEVVGRGEPQAGGSE